MTFVVLTSFPWNARRRVLVQTVKICVFAKVLIKSYDKKPIEQPLGLNRKGKQIS